MNELEVKVIEINKDDMIAKLTRIGAQKIFEGEIYSEFFDFPDNRLSAYDSLLRLRTHDGKKGKLTFKKRINNKTVKAMQEEEISADDVTVLRNILTGLGLEKKATNRKKRTSYRLHNVCFEIDEINNIPPYLEIEAPTKELIFAHIKELEIKKSQVKTWSTSELLAHYNS